MHKLHYILAWKKSENTIVCWNLICMSKISFVSCFHHLIRPQEYYLMWGRSCPSIQKEVILSKNQYHQMPNSPPNFNCRKGKILYLTATFKNDARITKCIIVYDLFNRFSNNKWRPGPCCTADKLNLNWTVPTIQLQSS